MPGGVGGGEAGGQWARGEVEAGRRDGGECQSMQGLGQPHRTAAFTQ